MEKPEHRGQSSLPGLSWEDGKGGRAAGWRWESARGTGTGGGPMGVAHGSVGGHEGDMGTEAREAPRAGRTVERVSQAVGSQWKYLSEGVTW